MPKEKNKMPIEKKNYLHIFFGVFFICFFLLVLGRVDFFFKIRLFLYFLFGDFTFLILIFSIIYFLWVWVFLKKLNLAHVYFIGAILIYIGLSSFAQLGLYSALSMDRTTIFTKTMSLYSRYIDSYQLGFSFGGGFFVVIICQIFGFLGGKIGIILLGISSIMIGFLYFMNEDVISLIKRGGLRKIPKLIIEKGSSYLKKINYPKKREYLPVGPSILKDTDEIPSFTIQIEVNNEKSVLIKEFIAKRHLIFISDKIYTSFTSSRFTFKMPNKNKGQIVELLEFFERDGLPLIFENKLYIDVKNQFKKLLTLKALLALGSGNKYPLLMLDIDGSIISFSNRLYCVFGDNGSGIKTFVRSVLASVLFQKVKYENIYFYDMAMEYPQLENTSICYCNNPRSLAISLDEGFLEYERRLDLIKYYNCDTIEEVNKKIKELGNEFEIINERYYFISIDEKSLDQAMVQRLTYFMQYSTKVGFKLMFIFRDRQIFNKLKFSNFEYIFFYTKEVSLSIDLFGSDIASRLQKKGDALIYSKKGILHGQSPFVSIDDFEVIINSL